MSRAQYLLSFLLSRLSLLLFEVAALVGFGGTVETRTAADGTTRHVWLPSETVDAVAYDTPVVGWRGH